MGLPVFSGYWRTTFADNSPARNACPIVPIARELSTGARRYSDLNHREFKMQHDNAMIYRQHKNFADMENRYKETSSNSFMCWSQVIENGTFPVMDFDAKIGTANHAFITDMFGKLQTYT